MSLLGFLRKSRAAVQSAGGGEMITTAAQLESAIRAALQGNAAGVAVDAQSAMAVPAVFACVRLISGAISNLPLDVKRRIGEGVREDAVDHPVAKLLHRRPNRWQTPRQFRQVMTTHILLRGNAYALIVRSGKKVVAVVPLDPDRMKPRQRDDHMLVYEYRLKSGRKAEFLQPEIMHLTGISTDGITGMSVIQAARESIGLSMAQDRHGAQVFRNAAKPSSVVVHPGAIGTEALDNIRQSLDAYREGGESEGRTLVLEEGVEIKTMSMTSQDAQWIEGRKFSRSDIAMFFGVPPHLIGDTEKGTSWGTGIEQQTIGFITYTLEDYLSTWEQVIERDLIGDGEPDVYARHNRAALVRGDIKTRQGFYTSMLQWGVMSPNEVRALEDLNPRPDGDGDRFYEPPNTAGEAAGAAKSEDEEGTK